MPISKKNILILPKWYPNKENPYHGIFIHRHAVTVSETYNVFVLFAKSSMQKEMIKHENSIIDKVEISTYYYKKSITGFSSLDSIIKLILFFICCFKGWNELRKQNVKIDILHVNVLGRTSFIASLLNTIYKIPIVITEHWSGYFKERNQYKGFLRKYIDRKVCKKSKAIITVSDSLKGALQKHNLKNNFTTIRNVVVDEYFESILNKEDRNQFLVVADQDNDVKNIQGIINAFSKFNKYGVYNLIIIGGGKDLNINRAYVNKLNLEKNIHLRGEQNSSVIIKELEKSMGLILFSNFENSPCVIGESCAVGVPVIATNVGGVKELINSEIGILIEPNDENQLLEALNKVVNTNYDRSIIRNYAFDNFSQKKIGAQLSIIYNSI